MLLTFVCDCAGNINKDDKNVSDDNTKTSPEVDAKSSNNVEKLVPPKENTNKVGDSKSEPNSEADDETTNETGKDLDDASTEMSRL